jgi:hypothetical protein
VTKQTHQLGLVTARLQLVEERAANCSSSNFIRADAPQYPHIAAARVSVD